MDGKGVTAMRGTAEMLPVAVSQPSSRHADAIPPRLIVGIFLVKICCGTLFSSEYQDQLFIPFVKQFITCFGNPWDFVYHNGLRMEFPYHPMILYVLSIFYALPYYVFGCSLLVVNFFFKIPTVLSDLMVFYILIRLFPYNIMNVIIFYLVSPIVFYAAYFHSQLDLIPTSLLFAGIYLITVGKYFKSSLCVAFSVCMKLHVIAAVPLILIYIYKKHRYSIIKYISIISMIYAAVCFPFMFSDGFYHLVLANKKQTSLFEASLFIGGIELYIILLVSIIIYGRFMLYNRINNDLFFSYLAILFSCFVIFVKPSPGWYIWSIPYLSIFFIKNYKINDNFIYVHFALSFCYLTYFLFFNVPDYGDLSFLGSPINLKISNPVLTNISFTTLVAVLVGIVILFYKYGVRTNSTYCKRFGTVIGISGNSGAGKTTVLGDLLSCLGGEHGGEASAAVLEGDADHKWERGAPQWSEMTHLNPKANRLYQQAEDVLALKGGKRVHRRDYDHSCGRFSSLTPMDPKEYIIVCGLHSLYLPKLRRLFDLKIFLDTDERLCKHWKVLRDVKERGHPPAQILRQIDERSPDVEKFIWPQRQFADLTIRYFPIEDFDVSDLNSNPSLGLEIWIDSSIRLEHLVDCLNEERVPVEWDFADDLHQQYLRFQRPIEKGTIERISAKHLVSDSELLSRNPNWVDGYRGLVQLIAVMAIDHYTAESHGL